MQIQIRTKNGFYIFSQDSFNSDPKGEFHTLCQLLMFRGDDEPNGLTVIMSGEERDFDLYSQSATDPLSGKENEKEIDSEG